MIKKILVPLDGSKRAESILLYIDKIANEAERKLIFLTVIEKKILYITLVGSFDRIAEFEEGRRKSLYNKYNKYLTKLEYEYKKRGN